MNSRNTLLSARFPAGGPMERRLSQRFCPRRVMTCQIEPAEGGARIVATVLNLSARGIGLVCQKTWTMGSELRLRILNPSATSCLVVTLRVMRSEAALTGGHFLGCEFTRPLDPEELRPILM
jgi:hypothetical protein